jgi:hypothetical protein
LVSRELNCLLTRVLVELQRRMYGAVLQ